MNRDWASDARASEAAPRLRQPNGGGRPVHIDDIVDALRDLERLGAPDASYRRLVRRKGFDDWTSGPERGSLTA
jgi:hypothetical protein